MRPILAALIAAAMSLAPSMRAPAKEAEVEPPGPTTAQPSLPRGALACALSDDGSALVHVLLCRFEESEGCTLNAPAPFRDMMQKFEGIQILKIGATPEGCSEITFSGSLKNPQ